MAVPSLSADAEAQLWQAMRSGNNADDAKRRVIEAHLKQVILTARRYEGRGLVFADLVQEGNLGLIRAIERFDPSRDGDFTSFADDWIDFAITSAIG
jgi:RNA polymerase primary sigma factor